MTVLDLVGAPHKTGSLADLSAAPAVATPVRIALTHLVDAARALEEFSAAFKLADTSSAVSKVTGIAAELEQARPNIIQVGDLNHSAAFCNYVDRFYRGLRQGQTEQLEAIDRLRANLSRSIETLEGAVMRDTTPLRMGLPTTSAGIPQPGA